MELGWARAKGRSLKFGYYDSPVIAIESPKFMCLTDISPTTWCLSLSPDLAKSVLVNGRSEHNLNIEGSMSNACVDFICLLRTTLYSPYGLHYGTFA